jgi:hypothetical protein
VEAVVAVVVQPLVGQVQTSALAACTAKAPQLAGSMFTAPVILIGTAGRCHIRGVNDDIHARPAPTATQRA